MVYKYVTTEVGVEVDISEFDTDDLIEELKNRQYDYNTNDVDADAMRELLQTIWMNRRTGKDYQSELDALIYGVLGKIL